MQPFESAFQERLEVIRHLEGYVQEIIDQLLLQPDKAWQPTDFLPDLTQPDYAEQIAALRERASGVPAEVFCTLVGNMITEEALPSYQTYINLIYGINEQHEQASEAPWVKWTRIWTAEENRHGDLLNKYLYLSGRADMRAIEQTIHWLLVNGFNPKTDACPYRSIIYTSFQERATKISHFNTGRLAEKAGDTTLSKMCRTIAGDEARHEKAYQAFMTKIFAADPNGALLAFEDMMRKQIVMPAVNMDSNGNNLFERYAAVTQKMGIYTTFDYADIIGYLVDRWQVESLLGLSAAAAKAQDYLSTLAAKYRRIADRLQVPEDVQLAWVNV